MQKQQYVQHTMHQSGRLIGATVGRQDNMKTIWSKINERFTRKSGERGRATTSVTSTYNATDGDFYIGVNSEKTTTVYLPAAAGDGKIVIIKAEMRPPLGSRRVNIATTDGSLIDGYSEAAITVSHGCKVLIRNDGQWYIIS